MGKATKAVKEFIDGIPDRKLKALPTKSGTIHSNNDLRLDMQGMTTDKSDKKADKKPDKKPEKKPDKKADKKTDNKADENAGKKHNLQVQVNKGTSISSLKKLVPSTVAGPVLVPQANRYNPAQIRKGLSDNVLI